MFLDKAFAAKQPGKQDNHLKNNVLFYVAV